MPKRPFASMPEVIGFGSVTNSGLVTGEGFFAVVVTAIGNGLEFIDAEDLLCLRSDVGKLRPIRALVRHLMRDDQMMFGIDCNLNIVADDTKPLPLVAIERLSGSVSEIC